MPPQTTSIIANCPIWRLQSSPKARLSFSACLCASACMIPAYHRVSVRFYMSDDSLLGHIPLAAYVLLRECWRRSSTISVLLHICHMFVHKVIKLPQNSQMSSLRLVSGTSGRKGDRQRETERESFVFWCLQGFTMASYKHAQTKQRAACNHKSSHRPGSPQFEDGTESLSSWSVGVA